MQWTLRTKILLGYGVALVLLAIVLLVALADLQRLGRASDAILSENYRSIQAAEHMINALERQDSGILLYLLGAPDLGAEQFRRNESEFLQHLGRAKDNVTIDGEARILARIDTLHSEYLEAFADLLRPGPGGPAADPVTYREGPLPAFLAVRQATARLRELNQETMFEASARARDIARRATWSLVLVGLLVIAVGLTFSLILSNRLARPIQEVTGATRRIATGDYDVRVPADSSDELGELARQFNRMTAELRSYRDLNVEQLMGEKRKSEAIVESIDDSLIVVDAEMQIVNLNPAARELLGPRGHGGEGHHFLEVVKNESMFELVREAIRSGMPPDIEEKARYFTVRRDGGPRHFEIAVTPVRSRGRGPVGAVLMLRDVTQLKELDRMRSEFVTTASHELKTPLTSIAMSMDMLAERMDPRLDATERDLLTGAREDIQRLRILVGELLDLSRIEAGKIELDFQPVEVNLVCERVEQIMGPQAQEQGISLSLDIPADLPPVRADIGKITWVLTNLISNAIRYSSPPGHIDVLASRMRSKVQISVRDYGAGIPYEYQGRIFDRFVQVEADGSSGGTGLGLAICREVIRAHGGSIWVESTPGEGSTFSFTLPVAG